MPHPRLDGGARNAGEEQVVPFVARGLEEVGAHRRGTGGCECIRAVVGVAGGEHVVELSEGCLVRGVDRLDMGLP